MSKLERFVQNKLEQREQSIAKLNQSKEKNLALLVEALKLARDFFENSDNFLDVLQDEIDNLANNGKKLVMQDDEKIANDPKIFDCVIAEASRAGMVLCLDHIVRNKMKNGSSFKGGENAQDCIYRLNNIMPACDQQMAYLVQLFDEIIQVGDGKDFLCLMMDRVQEIRDDGIKKTDIVQMTMALSANYALSVCMMSLIDRDTDKLREQGLDI
jgi:hypothetical protein